MLCCISLMLHVPYATATYPGLLSQIPNLVFKNIQLSQQGKILIIGWMFLAKWVSKTLSPWDTWILSAHLLYISTTGLLLNLPLFSLNPKDLYLWERWVFKIEVYYFQPKTSFWPKLLMRLLNTPSPMLSFPTCATPCELCRTFLWLCQKLRQFVFSI